MKITIIKHGNIELHKDCKSFEFGTYQGLNWIKMKYQDGSNEIIHRIIAIKGNEDGNDTTNTENN